MNPFPNPSRSIPALLFCAAVLCIPVSAQTPDTAQTTIKANVDEVVLDIVVRNKKGKPITDLKADDITVTDNGEKQKLTSFRLVTGSDAVSQTGAATTLDPLRQIRLVTLAFDSMSEIAQRKTAQQAAIDLIRGEQGTNVFYSVVVVNTRLLVLQQFTKDKQALIAAVEKATTGLAASQLISDSDAIKNELRKNIGRTVDGADQPYNLQTAATIATQGTPGPGNPDNLAPTLAQIMLNMLRLDASVASQGTRLSLNALKALVQGLQPMPGRKSVLYFTEGLYIGPELDVLFRNLMGMANRANVTFYSVDTRGVMTFSQNSGATDALNAASAASKATTTRTAGGTSIEEMRADETAENAGRANVQLPIRELAESTGGFMIGDSNDLRGPLQRVNEEISSYYELSYNPGIRNYDGSFRKVTVTGRKDLVIHARNGYFALPPEARAAGVELYEMTLLKAISEGKPSNDVVFRSAAVVLKPAASGTEVSLLAEVPLRGLQPLVDAAKQSQSVHFSIAALVKNPSGEVVEKVTRDRSIQVTADQLKMGNFIDKMAITLPPGKYTLESAVEDRESKRIGVQSSQFVVPAKSNGVAISSLTVLRSYTPNAKGLDPAEPFQFQGGSITPTLNNTIPRAKDSNLRLFFVVYQDPSVAEKPTVEIEFLQNGKVLQKVPLPLPAADASGKIPYVMTIPAEAIPPGKYEIHAIAKQGKTESDCRTAIEIAAT